MRMHTAPISILAAGALALLAIVSYAAPGPRSQFADNSASAIPVDVELVLAVDVSYSMDPEEQALQREGYITGLTSREFLHALRAGMHGKIAVTYFEWAGPYDQKIIVPWRLIDGPEAASAGSSMSPATAPTPAAHSSPSCATMCSPQASRSMACRSY